jgi:hypothetical protein
VLPAVLVVAVDSMLLVDDGDSELDADIEEEIDVEPLEVEAISVQSNECL